MNKRAISPLIATVLLVGFVFILGLTLMAFYQDTVKNETKNVDEKIDVTNTCLYGVNLEFDQACDYNSNLSVRIKNNKNSNISAFNFQVLGRDGTSINTRVNKSMNGSSSGRYNFVYSGNKSNVNKILITPIIVTSQGYGECIPSELIVEKDIVSCSF